MTLRLACILGVGFLLSSSVAMSQTPTQLIRGIVRDKETKQVLVGVAVIAGKEGTIGAVTDGDGAFLLEKVPVGRVSLKAQLIGYQPYAAEDILLLSAKELVLDIELSPSKLTLQEAVVSSARQSFEPLNDQLIVSARSFTVDETERVAAGVNDPGRVALSYPGVQKGEDDTENQIIVRGNTPIGILWRLEGIDIPNPNHFALIGSSGGGLTVFSGQLLSRSDFSSGAMPAEYGNALSGAFDVHFRQGNDQKRLYRAKVGLLGLDFTAEGPIKRDRSSYLINYRYSTLGLLNKIGFHLVGDRVNNDFQDLSFNLAFRSKNNKRILTVFGLSGLSVEHYTPVTNPEKRNPSIPDNWEDRVKPAKMGALGTTLTFLPDNKSYLKWVVALTGSGIQRLSDTLNRQDIRFRYDTQRYFDYRIASSLTYNRKLSSRVNFKTGLIFNQIWFDFFKKTAPRTSLTNVNDLQVRTNVNGQGNTQLFQQYAQFQIRLASRWSMQTGYHFMHLFANNTSALDPRGSIQYQPAPNQRISFAYGLYSRHLPLMAYYFTDSTGAQINKNLKLLRSEHFVLAWHYYTKSKFRLSVEAYYQKLFHVPIVNDIKSKYWMLNNSEGFPEFATVSKGNGKNYGLDVSLEKSFSNAWFMLLTGSAYSSFFQPLDGKYYHSRFDSRFSSSATIGKEFSFSRGRILQVGGRFLYSGGFRYSPYDPVQSGIAGKYVALVGSEYTAQVAPYHRLDIRFSWRSNRKKTTTNLSLDVQNVLNTANANNIGYDRTTNTTFTTYRGSLVPVLAYQVDF